MFHSTFFYIFKFSSKSGSVFVPAGVETFKIDLESQQVSNKNLENYKS